MKSILFFIVFLMILIPSVYASVHIESLKINYSNCKVITSIKIKARVIGELVPDCSNRLFDTSTTLKKIDYRIDEGEWTSASWEKVQKNCQSGCSLHPCPNEYTIHIEIQYPNLTPGYHRFFIRSKEFTRTKHIVSVDSKEFFVSESLSCWTRVYERGDAFLDSIMLFERKDGYLISGHVTDLSIDFCCDNYVSSIYLDKQGSLKRVAHFISNFFYEVVRYPNIQSTPKEIVIVKNSYPDELSFEIFYQEKKKQRQIYICFGKEECKISDMGAFYLGLALVPGHGAFLVTKYDTRTLILLTARFKDMKMKAVEWKNLEVPNNLDAAGITTLPDLSFIVVVANNVFRYAQNGTLLWGRSCNHISNEYSYKRLVVANKSADVFIASPFTDGYKIIRMSANGFVRYVLEIHSHFFPTSIQPLSDGGLLVFAKDLDGARLWHFDRSGELIHEMVFQDFDLVSGIELSDGYLLAGVKGMFGGRGLYVFKTTSLARLEECGIHVRYRKTLQYSVLHEQCDTYPIETINIYPISVSFYERDNILNSSFSPSLVRACQ